MEALSALTGYEISERVLAKDGGETGKETGKEELPQLTAGTEK